MVINAKKVTLTIVAILILFAAYTLPPTDELTREGMLAIAAPLVCVVLWVSELVPPPITALFTIVFIPMLGLLPLPEAMQNFGITTVFFAIAASALTSLFIKTTIPQRFLGALAKWAKGSRGKVIFGFMVTAAFFSTFMSDMLCALLFIGITRPLLAEMGYKPGESRFGKALMLGIPGAAMIGGMATPVGSVINILAIGIVESTMGVTISFLEWCVVGIPCTIIVLVVYYLFLMLVCKPEPLTEEKLSLITAGTKVSGKLDVYEKKVIIVTVVLFVFWVAGSFVPALNTTLVAIVAVFIMFLPGLNMLTWDEFKDGVPWDVVLLFGSVGVFIAPFAPSGAAAFVGNWLGSVAGGLGVIGAVLVVSAIITFLNGFIPLGTASAAMFSAPIALVAMQMGISPLVIACIVGIGSAVSLLIPQNLVMFLSYNDGYYTTEETLKVGFIPTTVMWLCLAFMPMLVCMLLGW